MKKYFLIIVLLLFIKLHSFADEFEKEIQLHWQAVSEIQLNDESVRYELSFYDAQYLTEFGNYPVFVLTEPIYIKSDIEAYISDLVYVPLTDEEELKRDKDIVIPEEHDIRTRMVFQNKVPFAQVTLLPFRTNELSGKVEKLASFTLLIQTTPFPFNQLNSSRTYADHSVLSSGDWYKIKVTEDGVYKITYQDLEAMGIDPGKMNPSKFGVFGNGGDMLPESNSTFRYDDLQENAIVISGEDDGKFDTQDYILFYGDSPDEWNFNEKNKTLRHLKHPYDDFTYYFLTPDKGTGKRIQPASLSSDPTDVSVDEFDDLWFHEIDDHNLINTGRTWYGETFRYTTRSKTLPTHTFLDVVDGSKVFVKADFASSSVVQTTFELFYNNTSTLSALLSAEANDLYTYASGKTMYKDVTATGDACSIKIDYDPQGDNTAKGWLNYVEVQARSNISFKGGQYKFFDAESVRPEQTAEFVISGVNNNVKVWEVTDLPNATHVDGTITGSQLKFKIHTDSLREFVIFDGSDYKQVEFVKTIANQNLHAVRNLELVIIAPKQFLLEANELANLHREFDNMKVGVFAPEAIYNEFSSGSVDITAIRDFFKMLYDASDVGQELKYALLFGDGTFDTKDRIENNNNFVPTYQSIASLSVVSSFTADDYYAILDDEEDSPADIPDVGMGRLTVRSEAEARMMVQKIRDYMLNSDDNMGDWRNRMCFIADDENTNVHLKHAEQLCDTVAMLNPNMLLNKIYLDAYKQTSTPSGQRYPDVRRLISDQIREGVLCINYTGHGGELGWAHEQVLTLGDIGQMENYNKLPLFITATCEFSRFDNPDVFSAGEQLLLNSKGGALALFTTTRLAMSSVNYRINNQIYKSLMCKDEYGEYPRLGDVNRKSKNPNQTSFLNIHLLGDPVLRLKYPQYQVETVNINGQPVRSGNDTISALELVTVEGRVLNANGAIAQDFNGVVFPKIFDKPATITTLGNDSGSIPREFLSMQNMVYSGEASVNEGEFSFKFIVPKDISYRVDTGRISYYAQSNGIDATGVFDELLIGGTSTTFEPDNTGPDIEAYLNDTTFVNGDITLEDPTLIANLYDEHGVNALGNSIGHDIVAYLDEDLSHPYVLNSYYKSDRDDFTRGKLEFRFQNLEDGFHTLRIKAWDVYNNSSEVEINFNVSRNTPLDIDDVRNFPNPFTETTKFQFNHKHFNKDLKLSIRITSVDGIVVDEIGPVIVPADGYSTLPIEWDGTNSKGGRLAAGVYIYQIIVQGENGLSEQKSGKLVLLN